MSGNDVSVTETAQSDQVCTEGLNEDIPIKILWIQESNTETKPNDSLFHLPVKHLPILHLLQFISTIAPILR